MEGTCYHAEQKAIKRLVIPACQAIATQSHDLLDEHTITFPAHQEYTRNDNDYYSTTTGNDERPLPPHHKVDKKDKGGNFQAYDSPQDTPEILG